MPVVQSLVQLREAAQQHKLNSIQLSKALLKQVEKLHSCCLADESAISPLYHFAFNCQPGLIRIYIPIWLKLGFTEESLSKLFYNNNRSRPIFDLWAYLTANNIAIQLLVNAVPFALPTEATTKLYKQEVFLPVIRYDFIPFDPETMTGPRSTYYYFEPASPWLLRTDSVLVSKNKITLALFLGITENEIVKLAEAANTSAWCQPNISSLVAVLASGSYLPEQKFCGFECFLDTWLQLNVPKVSSVVILTQMVGDDEIEIEVLDTRSREISLASLCCNI